MHDLAARHPVLDRIITLWYIYRGMMGWMLRARRGWRQAAFVMVVAFVFSSAPSYATGPRKNSDIKELGQPKVRLRWLSGFGRVFDIQFPETSTWTWAEFPRDGLEQHEDFPSEIPVLRTKVAFPPSIEVLQASSRTARVELQSQGILRSKGQILIVDSATRVSSVDLILKTQKQDRMEITLAVVSEADEPVMIAHPECRKLGIAFYRPVRKTGERVPGNFHYVAAFCRPLEDSIDIFLIHSEDAAWLGTSFSKPLRSGRGWFLHRVKSPKEFSSPRRILGKFGVSDPDRSNRSTHYVVYRHKGKSSRSSVSAGVGTTLLQYSEEPRGQKISMLGITPKINATYQLVPDLIDIGGNAFINAATFKLSSQPHDLPVSRFFGLNARIGLNLPIEMGAISWSVLLGWYYWGMLVPDGSYGIASTSGPQIFLSGRFAQVGHRTIFGYIKYAPLSTRPGSLSLGNRELALGAGYELTPPGEGRAWLLTLDVSNLDVQAENVANRVKLNSFTLGISTSL